MEEYARYKAKVACRVGGAYRRAGEVFSLPRYEATPPFLEEVPNLDASGPADDSGAHGRRRSPKASPSGPMPADLPGAVRD